MEDIKLGLDINTKSAQSSLKKLASDISKATSDGNSNIDNLEAKFKKATVAVAEQSKKVEELKTKLDGLQSGKIKARGVESLQNQLIKARDTLTELKSKLDAVVIAEEKITARQSKGIYRKGDDVELQKLANKTDDLTTKTSLARAEVRRLETALKDAVGTGTQIEIEKTNLQLQKAQSNLDAAKAKANIAGDKFNKAVKEGSNSLSGINASMEKFGNRILGLAKRVFIFTLFTKAFRALRDTVGNVLMANSSFVNSLAQLQASLWTAFSPIISYIIPVIKTLMSWITALINLIGKFISLITGKSYSAMQSAGKAYEAQARAVANASKSQKKLGKSLKDNNKEIKKSIADFDELSILQDNSSDSTDSGAGSGGAGGGGKSPFDFPTTNLDKVEEKLKGIGVLVGSIGTALLAWKITDFVQTLLAGGKEADALKSKLSGIAGIILIIAGSVLLVKGYSDAWVNGIDWTNFALTISGLALLIGGIALAISPLAAGFVAIGGGIALFILGIKDLIANGPAAQNILTIIIGLLVVLGATWLIAGAPIAIVVTAITALVGAFVYLWKNNEDFRQFWINLWNTIRDTAVNIWENNLKPTLQAIGDFFNNLWTDYIQPFWENNLKPTLQAIGDCFNRLWTDYIQPFWETHVKPFLDAAKELAETLWTEVIKPTMESIGEKITWLWDNYLSPIKDFIVDVFKVGIENSINTIGDVFDTVFNSIGELVDDATLTLTGLKDFISGVFKGDWDLAWKGIKETFSGVFNALEDIAKTPINAVIDLVNGMIQGIQKGLNLVIDKVNGLNIDIPDWVPGVGGKHIGFNVSRVNWDKIPKLAQGAVLPPNKPFLSVVGDQTSGTNVETPLSTMIEAFNTALQQNGGYGNQPITIEIDGREFGRAVLKQGNREAKRTTGKLVFG